MDFHPYEHVAHGIGFVWIVAAAATALAALAFPALHARRRGLLNVDVITGLCVGALVLPPLWVLALIWSLRGEYIGASAGGAFPVLTVAKEKP